MGSRELAKSEAMGLWAKPYEGVKAIRSTIGQSHERGGRSTP